MYSLNLANEHKYSCVVKNVLEVSLNNLNDKLHFNGVSGKNEPISIDYIPPLGDGLGYTSLELLLLSLSSCVASTILAFLRKMGKTITGTNVSAIGNRKTEHPTGFESIKIELNIQSNDLTNNEMDKVIQQSEELYCPVWSMLKGNVDIVVDYKILNENK